MARHLCVIEVIRLHFDGLSSMCVRSDKIKEEEERGRRKSVAGRCAGNGRGRMSRGQRQRSSKVTVCTTALSTDGSCDGT